MTRSQKIRALTGCVRRKAKRDVADAAREMHLSTAEVGLRDLLQRAMVVTHHESCAAYATLAPLISLVLLLVHSGRNEHAAAAADILLHQVRKYHVNTAKFEEFFRTDHELFDIPPEGQANHNSQLLDRQFLVIEDWGDQKCYQYTGFNQGQLHEIYQLFGLEEVADEEPHIGYIAVPNGQGKYHKIHPVT